LDGSTACLEAAASASCVCTWGSHLVLRSAATAAPPEAPLSRAVFPAGTAMPLLFASREEETRLGVVGTALLAGVGVGLLSVVWRGALDGENCIGAVCVPMD